MENTSSSDPYSTDYDIYKCDRWISRADIYLTSNDKHALISVYLRDRLIIQRFKISRTQWTPEPEKTVTVDPRDGELRYQEGFIYQFCSPNGCVVIDSEYILEHGVESMHNYSMAVFAVDLKEV
jgi:hypothetical protein